MARNIPYSIHFTSEDDSDMPNSFNTTGTPDDSYAIMDNTTETPNDSHAIMDNTTATPDDSHVIVDNTTVTTDDSHAIDIDVLNGSKISERVGFNDSVRRLNDTARNIPLVKPLFELNSPDEDSDIPNSFNTTGTPDDSHAIIDNELNGSEYRVGFINFTEDQRDHAIPTQFDRYFAYLKLDREEDSKTAIRNKVFVFDMRGKIEKSVKGKFVFIEASLGVLKQRLASMNGVLQDQILIINVPENTITTITYAAILDSSIQNLTVFLKLDPEELFYNTRCINLPKDSGVKYLLDTLNLSQPSWPFLKGQRLQNTSSLVDQGVVSGDSIDLCKIRTENVKCLFRAAPKYEQLFTVECLTIDSIFELKQKIRETIRNLNRTSNSISESVLNSHIWLTSGKRIYRDEEYICLLESGLDYSSNSSDRRITTYYDFVLHFQPADCIPINVSYRVGDARFPTVETVFVPEQSSSTHLCEHISKLLNCLPTAVKLIIQGKKLPMNDDLSTFSEFKPGCEVHASVKRAITVKVTIGDELLKFHVMKLDKVESLKCKIADKIKQLPRVLKLEFKGKELVDFNRIEQENIKDNSTVNAEIVENRIQISIRKRKHPITHLIVENVEETMIRDLKNYYRHVVRLSAKLDIDLYKNNMCSQLDDFTTLKAVGIKDKEIMFASEKNFANVPYMKIYEASRNGIFTMKFRIIHNGVPFYSPVDPGTVTEDSNNIKKPSTNDAYSLPSTCCNIRIARSFEVEPFEFSLSPEPLLHVQSPLSMNPIPQYPGPLSINNIPPYPGPLSINNIPQYPGPLSINNIPPYPGPLSINNIPPYPGPLSINNIPQYPGPLSINNIPPYPGPLSINNIPQYPGPLSINNIPPYPGPLSINNIPPYPGPLSINNIPPYYGVQSSQIIRQFSDMYISSTNTVMNTLELNTSRDPPEVINNKELHILANELPGHKWQFFIRSLDIPNAVVLQHTEAYPRNVAEAIFQCLSDWKQRKGRDAKKCIIQKELNSQGLQALSEQIFGYDTV